MFKDILVPLDGSAQSWKALAQAIELAKVEGSIVRGLYVVDVRRLNAPQAYFQTPHGVLPSPYVRTNSELEGWYFSWGAIVLHTMEETCRQSGIACAGTIGRGLTAEVVCQQARSADLVVLGHHPHRGNGVCHRGSTLGEVTRKAQTPVLVTTGDARQVRRVLLPYSEPKADSRVLHMAARFSQSHGLPLTILVVAHRPQSYLDKTLLLGNYLKPYSMETKFLPADGHLAQTIIGVADAETSDIIFAGTYRHNGLLTAILGSTLDKVVDRAPCPVLICP